MVYQILHHKAPYSETLLQRFSFAEVLEYFTLWLTYNHSSPQYSALVLYGDNRIADLLFEIPKFVLINLKLDLVYTITDPKSG